MPNTVSPDTDAEKLTKGAELFSALLTTIIAAIAGFDKIKADCRDADAVWSTANLCRNELEAIGRACSEELDAVGFPLPDSHDCAIAAIKEALE